MRRIFFILSALLLSLSAWAQELVLQGRIVDAKTGEALPYVSIYAGAGRGTLSNDDGDFKLVAEAGSILTFSCIGYDKLSIYANKMHDVIRLKPYSTTLQEVTVLAPDNNQKILKQVINNLKRDYSKQRKWTRKYFFRTMTEMNDGTYIAEAFMKAHSVVNIRSAMITSGLQGNDVDGNGGTLNVNSSNIHRLIEVGPTTHDSQFWQNAIKPFSNYSMLCKYYDTKIQHIHGDDGKTLYRIECTWKKSTSPELSSKRCISGIAYVDAETLNLLRFDGSAHNYTVNLGWLINFATTIDFHLEYDYSQGAASVSNLSIHGGNAQMLFHALLYAIEPDVEKSDKVKGSGSNIVTALRDAGYDARLWEKYDIVKRTREEERAVFGYVKPLPEESTNYEVDTIQNDNDELRSLWQRLWLFSKRYAQEKVFVHMDNTSYCLGDTIWFAAYMRDTENKEPSKKSSLLYVELLNQEGFLVDCKQVEIVEGYGSGFFALNNPGQYAGFYELRAYTRWQLNWGVHERKHPANLSSHFVNKEKEKAFFRDYDKLYSRVFPVYDQLTEKDSEKRVMTLRPLMGGKEKQSKRQLDVQVYPEGGHLIAGMETYIAFEATWNDGEWAEGELHFGNKTMQTTSRGRGRLLIKPDADMREPLTFVAKDGTKAKVTLPVPQRRGVTIHAEEKADAWDIMIKTTADLTPQNLGLSIMNEGKISYFRQLKDYSQEFHIPTSSLQPGVNQATVFDDKGHILADRLFFVWKEKTMQPTLKIEGLRDNYKPFEVIELHISCAMGDSTAYKYPHYFSLAVRDGERLACTYDNANILTEMLLASEIRGYVPDAEWYFQKNDSVHHDALDLLLMVQGWRRFSWEEMATNEKWAPSQPKEKAVALIGNVDGIPQNKTDIKHVSDVNWVLHTEVVDLSNMNHTHTYNALYDDGRFSISLPNSYSNYIVFMDIMEKKQDKEFKEKKDRNAEEVSAVKDARKSKMTKKEKKTKEKVKEENNALDNPNPCIRMDDPYPRYVHPYGYYQQHLPEGDIQRKQRSYLGFKDSNPTTMISSGEAAYAIDDAGLISDGQLSWGASVLTLNSFNDDITLRRGLNRFRRNYENMHLVPSDSIYAHKYLKSYPMSFQLDDYELDEYKGEGSIENYVFYTDANLRNTTSSDIIPLTVVEYPYPDGFKHKMPASRSFSMPSYAPRVQFYHPNYTHKKLPEGRQDYRRTLYWDPCLKLDENGEIHVIFYNNSRTTHLNVEAEGQATDGTLLWGKTE